MADTRQEILNQINNYNKLQLNGTRCVGYQQLTLSGVTKMTVPSTAQKCIIEVECVGESVAGRYTLDGTTPSSTVGVRFGDADVFEISDHTNLDAAKFYPSKVTILNIHYYA